MKRYSLLLLIFLCPLFCFAQPPEVVPIVPAEVVAVDAAESPQASLRRLSRADRRLAKEVRNDAAEALEMSRWEFNRACLDENPEALWQLRLSLAEQDAALAFDEDKWDQIFAMIQKWIEMIMAIFVMFG